MPVSASETAPAGGLVDWFRRLRARLFGRQALATSKQLVTPVKPASTLFREENRFLYCTHPDTWRRIGFPGPSFEAGGYRDFDQPQEFMGEARGET